MQFGAGELVSWDPANHPYDEPGASGRCRFAPGCGGITYGDPPRTTRPDEKGCPDNPAAFDERLGMNEASAVSGTGGAAEKRYMAICRPRAVRRFGAKAVADVEREAGA